MQPTESIWDQRDYQEAHREIYDVTSDAQNEGQQLVSVADGYRSGFTGFMADVYVRKMIEFLRVVLWYCLNLERDFL